jgi:hypothetical protein
VSFRDKARELAERVVVGSTELDAQKAQQEIDEALRKAAEGTQK